MEKIRKQGIDHILGKRKPVIYIDHEKEVRKQAFQHFLKNVQTIDPKEGENMKRKPKVKTKSIRVWPETLARIKMASDRTGLKVQWIFAAMAEEWCARHLTKTEDKEI